jgi:enoyl-CoA hydratase/carnithine racemase
LREQADILDKIGASLFNTYQSRTGMDEQALKAMLATDTWLTAEECLANGFCDQIIDPIKAQASFNVDALPENAKALYAQETPENTDPNEILGDGTEGEPFEEAPEVPQTDLDDDDDTLAKARALAKEQALAYSKTVVELCALAGMPNKAAGFIGASTSLDDVRAKLLAAKANGYQPLDVAQPQANQKPWAQMSLTEKSTLIRENPTIAKQLQSLE